MATTLSSPPNGGVGERRTDQRIEPHGAQIAVEQLQAGVRRQGDVAEVEGKIAVDAGRQIGFSLSHCQGPFVGGRRVGSRLLSTTTEGRFQLQSAEILRDFCRIRANIGLEPSRLPSRELLSQRRAAQAGR